MELELLLPLLVLSTSTSFVLGYMLGKGRRGGNRTALPPSSRKPIAPPQSGRRYQVADVEGRVLSDPTDDIDKAKQDRADLLRRGVLAFIYDRGRWRG